MKRAYLAICSFLLATQASCAGRIGPAYDDRPFAQDFAEKVTLHEEVAGARLFTVRADRNGRVLVLSDRGLLQVCDGKLVPDRQHRPLADMEIKGLDTYRDQLVYLTDEAVLSNAWAGRFYVPHGMQDARLFQMGEDFAFLLIGKASARYFDGEKEMDAWTIGQPGYGSALRRDEQQVKQVCFDRKRKRFVTLSPDGLDCLAHGRQEVRVFQGTSLNCMGLTGNGAALLVGTEEGFIELDAETFSPRSALQSKLPWPDIRCIAEGPRKAGTQIDGKTWFGTPKGAFALHANGQIDYYASKRWLVDDYVVDIAKGPVTAWRSGYGSLRRDECHDGPDESVLILTKKGLSIIHFKMMTLEQKTRHFERLTRKRHVRYGLNSAFVMAEPGELSTGTLVDQDNDGLWTAMYLAGELFRYAVTKSQDALKNCYESFEAMERLSRINPVKGFPSRAFERYGYQLADKTRWHRAEDEKWAWKGTTSSDEIVGHFFAYSIFAEIVPDEKWRGRAVALMDEIMEHIIRNNWYLVDYDGKPTLWGRWHPEYVNQFPHKVGDRKLNSAEIISFLQATYHFTGKEIYKEKGLELLEKHGYLENIMTPVSRLGRVEGVDLTTEWNHSDDELAFLSYWNLYKYAFSQELREKYRQVIKDHWEIERPERNPLWSFIYAATGAKCFDLEAAIWSLKQFPLDTISWTVRNSHRKDLEFLAPNFREQTIGEVLPPDERPMSKHNRNAFDLDGGNGGRREYSGDIYLLPYWMGRFLKKIR
jgi:hypothetical protein